jgi:hypothetical protein
MFHHQHGHKMNDIDVFRYMMIKFIRFQNIIFF